MRFIFNFFNFLVLLMFILGCSSEDDQPRPSTKPEMGARIDNVAWAASDFSAVLNSSSDNYLNIVGINPRGTEITLTIPAVTGTGTFSTATSNQVSGKYENRVTGEYWTSNFGGSCTITLIKLDRNTNRVSGTFSFTGNDISKKVYQNYNERYV